MKIYSKKHFILGLICLGFFLFCFRDAWLERNEAVHSAWLDCILFFLLTAIEFRAAFVKKYAAATLIAEQDELEKLRWYKVDRFAFWTSVWFLLWVSCFVEQSFTSQPAFAYGFLAAAALLLLLRWGFTLFYSFRLSRKR